LKSVVPPTPVAIGRVDRRELKRPKRRIPMARILLMSLRIFLVVGFVAIAFGAVMPTSGPHATPYFSTLSNLAVSTAEACPCNFKACSGNVCVYHEDWGCCVQGGVCKSISCF